MKIVYDLVKQVLSKGPLGVLCLIIAVFGALMFEVLQKFGGLLADSHAVHITGAIVLLIIGFLAALLWIMWHESQQRK